MTANPLATRGVADPDLALTILREDWLSSLQRNAATEGGKMVLPSGATIPDQQRKRLEAAERSLTCALSETAGDDEIAVEVYELLAAYPLKAEEAHTSAKLRGKAYMTAFAGMPLWAIRKAKERALREGIGGDPRFAPTPTQMHAAVQEAMRPVRSGAHQMRRVLEAETMPPPICDAERERRRQRVDEMMRGTFR